MLRGWLAAKGRLPGGDAALLARTVRWGRALVRRGDAADAALLYHEAERRARGPEARLALRVRRTRAALAAGVVPDDLWATVGELLARADDRVEEGDLTATADELQHALVLAFHRTLHLEDTPSPLAEDPQRFLAPLRASNGFRAVARPGDRPARPTVRATRDTRPTRLLFVAHRNWHFATDLVEEYRAAPGVEVRTLDLADLSGTPWSTAPTGLLERRLHQALGKSPAAVPDDLREPFDWADTVFVEWADRSLPWVSLLPDVPARVVVRLHSYESLTAFPQYADWSAIDDVVFVSPHIRALVEATLADRLDGVRRHTIPNRNVLSEFRLPKLRGADQTLGMVGWNNVTKDTAWTLDLLEELRRVDDRWRLRLVGAEFPRAQITGGAARYRDELERRIVSLGGAVQRPGYTTDVAEALRHIGVIVSSSRREGTHEGLIQGGASGAWPVVRNWPYVARWGGARTMMRDDWVVDTPQQAAAQVLAATADPARFADLCAETADWITSRYDWSVVRPALDAVLLDETDGPAA